MSELNLLQEERPAVTSVFYILVTTVIGFYILGPMIGAVLAIPFMEGGFSSLLTALTNLDDHPEIKTVLFIIQGSATFFGLIIGPALYWYTFEKRRVFDLVRNRPVSLWMLLLTGMAVICFMAPNSLIIEWNSNLTFPDFLKGFEVWARDRENEAERLTHFLTTFDSLSAFLIAFVVIAVLPGIGEELVFRGMLQPKLEKGTGNIHAAIWISALLFSMMHMQFFGFFPRMFLGAFFGYLYAWSGNLLIPITAHFINNGVGVLMLYLHQKGKVDIDIESSVDLPWTAIITGTILTFGLVFYLKQLFKRNTAST